MYRLDTRQLLVCAEKNATLYWPADTPEEFAESCFHILKERVDSQWMYSTWDIPEPPAGMMTKEQIAELPEGPVRDAARRQRNMYVRDLREVQENNRTVEEAKRVVAAGDMAPIPVHRKSTGELIRYESAAWRVLRAREAHQYEYVVVERFSHPRP